VARPRTLRYVDPDARRGRLYLAIAKFSTTDAAGWLARQISWKVDPLLLRITNGRFSTAAPLAAALLETTGARTGEPRRTATLYFHDGDRVTIIPSYRGDPRHPAWYHNIKSDPNVTFGGLPFRAVVVTDDDERRRLWTLADRVYPAFAEFRERASAAGREIPIVQLTRR
jgi:deazaflavin-dependent oxidoreductase (nitroreductase family)